MPLTLAPVQPDDFTAFADLMFDAVGYAQPFVNACWPRAHHLDGTPSPEGRQLQASIMLAESQSDPTQVWLKVTDTDLDRIIGVAQYNVYPDMPAVKPAEEVIDAPDGYWRDEEEKEWAQALFRAEFEDRWRWVREATRPLVCLDILTVMPGHQRRGAGTLLTQWGIDEANRLGADLIVEAFGAGVPLYEKLGFATKREFVSEVPAKFADKPKQRVWFMHKAPN